MNSLKLRTERPRKATLGPRATGSLMLGLVMTFVVLLPAGSYPSGPLTEDFSGPFGPDGIPRGWETLEFPKIKRHTTYSVERENDNDYLRAESNNSASGIYKEVAINLAEYPVLSWRWKIEGIIEKGDATKKAGDDYAARVYVTFEYDPETTPFVERLKYRVAGLIYGKLPANAINYIWANRLPKGEHIVNPFTEKAIMVAVESGAGLAGEWVEEKRNVYEDYREFFGAEPPRVVGIAIMTDSDNTGQRARACYDDIVFSRGSEQGSD